VFDDLDVNEYKRKDEVSKGRVADVNSFDNLNHKNPERNLFSNSSIITRSKSPSFKSSINDNFNKNYNQNFDGFKNNQPFSAVKQDWMVDFAFSDDNKSNNNKNANNAHLEDHGFDFDFVNTPNTNQRSNSNSIHEEFNNFNKQISKQEIKENFEDFVWTSSITDKDTTKTQQVKINNNTNNFFEFGNNQHNNDHNNRTNKFIGQNVSYNKTNYGNNINLSNFNQDIIYGNQVGNQHTHSLYTHKNSSSNQVNNNMNLINNNSTTANKSSNDINFSNMTNSQTQSTRNQSQQNIYDFFK